MKKTKRILAAVMAVLSLSLLIPTIAPVQAATTEKVYVNYTSTYDSKTGDTVYKSGKTTLVVSTFTTSSFRVRSVGGTSKIKELKSSNSKSLLTKVTYSYGAKYSNYRESTISIYAKKKGSYQVTFKVGSKSYKMKIKALDSTNAITKATYGSTVLSERIVTENSNGYSVNATYRSKVSSTSDKFKVTANTDAGYKITGLVVASANAKGKVSYKAVKNGAKITLSKGKMKYTSDDVEYVDAKKYTYVYVSYKNTQTGESVKYSVGTDPSTKAKAVKCVRTSASGDKSTAYDVYGNDSSYAIWK